MTPKEKALAWVDEHFDECLAELKNAVACESYAGNEAGLEKMRGTLEADLRRAGIAAVYETNPQHLPFAEVCANAKADFIKAARRMWEIERKADRSY